MTVLATETWTGTTGAAWPAQWTRNGATGSITIQSNAGAYALATGPNGYTIYSSAYLSGMALSADVDITFRVKFSTLNEQYHYVGVRTGTTNTGIVNPSSGYFLEFFPGNGVNSMGVGKWINGNEANVSGDLAAGQWVANTARWVRFRVVGLTQAVKIWSGAVTDEPANWLWQGNDTTYPADHPGKLLIFGVNGFALNAATATYDDLTILDATAAAPTSTFTLWNGTAEVTLTLAGIWNGTTIVPVTASNYTG